MFGFTERKCEDLNIKELWENGVESIPKFKETLQRIIRKRDEEIIKSITHGKKSLENYEPLGDPYYLKVVDWKQRGGLAWFRLKGWMWQGYKVEEQKRMCPLCGKEDSEEHIIVHCKELEGERDKACLGKNKIQKWNWVDLLKTKDEQRLKKLEKLLVRARKRRG